MTRPIEDFTVELVKIALHAKRGAEGVAYFYFATLDTGTLQQYRRLYSGGAGMRKGDTAAAVSYIFKRKFQRVEGMTLPLQEGQTEKDFFLSDERGKMIVDSVVNEYLSAALPEPEDIKE